MGKSFVLHDESKNTKGFKMLTSGANLDEFKKNPVMLLMHNDYDMPIGRWENIRVEGTQILADPVFDEQDEKAAKIKGKVDRDFVRMASIGSWAPEEIDYEPNPDKLGESIAVVTKWTVREASIVPIGSNHNAMYFYDRESGKQVDVKDLNDLIKLMDIKTEVTPNKRKMDELNKILKLADTATDAERTAAINAIISNADRLQAENATLTSRIDELNTAEKSKRSAEAIALIDAAVKDGRLDAKGKGNFIKLFDADFENAKETLEAIPQRGSVTRQIEAGKETTNVELADFTQKSWDELDKSGKLVQLKDKFPDLYAEKFETRFGCKPKA
jgi:hypothetical protein